jgi:signal transduction histidine kinase
LLRTTHDLDQVLRDLSRIIDNKNELHRVKESVDLKQEWDKCVDFLRDSVPAGSTIQESLTGLSPAFTVRAIIHSVFINLLSNSIKYRTPDRHLKVSVSATSSGHSVVIRFEDNGMGLDLDRYGDSVFKLFKRFHNHVEGRGMGLYLIKAQIESLNGSIQINSSVGTGTSFEISLPDVFKEEFEARSLVHS